jgi:hypothetical protein
MEQAIAVEKAKYAQQAEALKTQLSTEKDTLIAAKAKQLQGAANGFYGADKTFSTIKEPNRTDLVTNNFVREGWAALGNQMPDYATVAKINERLKNDLDETKVSLDELMRRHSVQVEINNKLSKEAQAKEAQIAELQKTISTKEQQYQATLLAKTQQLLAQDQRIIDAERERANDKQWIETQKRHLMYITGGLSALCVIGAIYLPLGRTKAAIAAIVFGGATLAINFIQPWHIAVGVGLAIIAIIARMAYEHNKEKIAATNVYRAIQEVKTAAKGVYDSHVAPRLAQWNTTYAKDGTLVPDKASEALIDKRLMEVGDK